MSHRTYISIGANLQDPIRNVQRAIGMLTEIGTVVKQSSLYRTKPWGVENQPDYINAVILLETALEPHVLLAALQAIEKQLGRTPAARWAPRIIDLDILSYDPAIHSTESTMSEPQLEIPHPRMLERAFVLVPLAEIDPSFEPLKDALSPADLATVRLLASGNSLEDA